MNESPTLTSSAVQEASGRHKTHLTRRDILFFERRLLGQLKRFLAFKGHSILFPKDHKPQQARWVAEENKLFLPLPNEDGTLLGIFMARGVEADAAEHLIAQWPALSVLIVENLLLYKQSLCDPATGLYSRFYLMHELSHAIEHFREPARPPLPASSDAETAERGSAPENAVRLESMTEQHITSVSGCLGIIVIRFSSLRDVVREFGYQFADTLVMQLAHTLQGICPEQGLAVRTGDMEFALLVPAATPKRCHSLATIVAQALRGVSLEHPLRKNRVMLKPAVGYALYPQDADTSLLLRSSHNQAALLLRQARMAAAMAHEEYIAQDSMNKMEPVMGFSKIVLEGGRIVETLPLSRTVVSLGSNMHAREGMRFSVWSTNYPVESERNPSTPLPPLYKGEIVLIEVQENASLAEIMHVGDPSWNITPGDKLRLLPEEQSSPISTKEQPATPDPVTGLLRHGDFLAQWIEKRETCQQFSLGLVRILPSTTVNEDDDEEQTESPLSAHDADHLIRQVSELCREELSFTLGGRYGITSLIFFHPDKKTDDLSAAYEKLIRHLEKRLPVAVAAGLASFPFLEFRKADTLENSRKALEYGILLPKPHLGCLDSLALNISADKLFSQGDIFGAVREYQNSILTDESNSMAWNSLGICLANVGRYAEAEHHLRKALEYHPNDPMIWYNLAFMQQSQNADSKAEEYYTTCLEHDPAHLFAMIRLGQLAENRKDFAAARTLYEKAATQPGGANPTCRHFARLCMAEGKPEEAREHLHEALLFDPQDAFALHLMARLYLDGGEDPDLAASFARQSVSLRPDLKAAWLELARALEAMGQYQQAKNARLKAGE